MVVPRSVARFNKRVTNRIQGIWAPYLPPYAVVVHQGRTSGREYRTPVLAFRSGTTIAIMVLYGEQSDWTRNLLASGQGGLERLGRLHHLTNPRLADAAHLQQAPAIARLAARRVPVLLADLSR